VACASGSNRDDGACRNSRHADSMSILTRPDDAGTPKDRNGSKPAVGSSARPHRIGLARRIACISGHGGVHWFPRLGAFDKNIGLRTEPSGIVKRANVQSDHLRPGRHLGSLPSCYLPLFIVFISDIWAKSSTSDRVTTLPTIDAMSVLCSDTRITWELSFVAEFDFAGFRIFAALRRVRPSEGL
jgi:hypothetical protein